MSKNVKKPAKPAKSAAQPAKRVAKAAGRNRRRKRYALVGVGGRSYMFSKAILTTYRDTCELVALCDVNQTRMDYANERFCTEFGAPGALPTYKPEAFDEMIRKHKVDVVIVTTVDRTHHRFLIRAMELGCDTITEKPMTTDVAKCRAILDAVRRTGRDLKVTFNYRYAPIRTKARELIAGGAIGEVKSVHFEWLLNTRHGADYFRRWHRDRRNSGGLLVHKATHHFDLVNWWIDSTPETVFAFGNLAFYGRENAEERGETKFFTRYLDNPNAKDDPFAIDLRASPGLRGLYLNAEKDDGYIRDQNVFGEGISIEDTMNVLVRYRSGVQMSYSLHAYAPWEGYRVAFNGTKGRLEINHQEASYINAENSSLNEGATSSQQMLLLPHFEKPSVVPIVEGEGGHGGGDPLLLEELFGKPAKDPLRRAANHFDGARSILTGLAANEAIATGRVVQVDDLLRLEEWM